MTPNPTLLLGTCLLFSTLTLQAQITVDGSQIPTGTDTIKITFDTNPASSINGGPTGGNQTWDFSALNNDDPEERIFADPANTPFAASFPSANLAVSEETDSWAYLLVNNSTFETLGFGEFDGGQPEIDKFNQTLFTFPSTFGTSYVDVESEGWVFKDPIPTSAGVPFDSLGFRAAFITDSEIDAWGTLKTPLGDWPSLRQNMQLIEVDSLFVYANGSWQFATSQVAQALGEDLIDSDTLYQFIWWSDNAEAKFPIVVFEYDTDDNSPEGDVEWLRETPAPPVSVNTLAAISSVKLFPNPASTATTLLHPEVNRGHVLLLDMLGNLLSKQAIEGTNTELSLEGLPSGMFLAQIFDQQGQLISQEKLSVAQR